MNVRSLPWPVFADIILNNVWPQPGDWLRKGMSTFGFVIGNERDRQVVYFSSTDFQVTTSSLREFCSDILVSHAIKLEHKTVSLYEGYFTGSKNYIQRCTTAQEVERNARYYAEHPERWQTYSQGTMAYIAESKAFACCCTSKVKNEINRDQLKLGNHIFTIVKKEILTTEHGIIIQCRKELRIVYFSEELSKITVTSIEEFTEGRPIGLAENVSTPVEEVVTLAMDFAQHPHKWVNEHHLNPSLRFAEFCKKGATQPIPFYIKYLKPGDHIFTQDDDECYRNHGIFLGGHNEQKEVALFSKANVFVSPHEFLQDKSLYLCNNPLPLLTASNILTMPKDDSKERVGYYFHSISESHLKPGDHIYAYRKFGAYQHHGIYVGIENSEQKVVHFRKRSDGAIKIDKTSIKTFKGWSFTLQLACYGADIEDMRWKRSGTTQTLESLPPQVVIARAQYYADHSDEWHEYNLIDNNCEMFAIYCKTGIRITGRSQIQSNTLGCAKYKYIPPV